MNRGTLSLASIQPPRARAALFGVGIAVLVGTVVACAGVDDPGEDVIGGVGSGGFAGFAALAGAGGAAGGSNVAGRGGAAGAVSGMGGAAGAPTRPRVYCDAMETVIQSSCGDVSCHGNPSATIGGWGVDAASVRPYIDKPSVRGRQCGVVIDSQNPNDSIILTKVLGTFPDENCGGTMPVGSFEPLTPVQIRCLTDWVQQFKR
jgi:hypothetical protein